MKPPAKNIINKATDIAMKILPFGAKLAIKAATLGVVSSSDIKEADEIIKDSSDAISDVIKKKIEEHKTDKKSIETFKTSLEEVASEIKKTSNYPLVFIIDELDRCKPTYALDVIEKIKHFFSVKNVVFILVMNKKQIENSVKSIYGTTDTVAATYLQKFINLECTLPKQLGDINSKGVYGGNDYAQYCSHLSKMHGLNIKIDNQMIDIAKAYNLSLRDIEKCYTYLTLFNASIKPDSMTIPILIAFLVIIKVKEPSIYSNFRNKKIIYKILEEKFDYLLSVPELKAWLMFLLLSGDELIQLSPMEYNKHRTPHFQNVLDTYSISKENVIPYFIEKIDSFEFVA